MADTDRKAFGQADRGIWGQTAAADIDVGLRKHMLQIYNYMASGLLLSGIVAIVVANTVYTGAWSAPWA